MKPEFKQSKHEQSGYKQTKSKQTGLRIVILGAGKMGSWLAHSFAQAGNKVVIYDDDSKKAKAVQDANCMGGTSVIGLITSFQELKTLNPQADQRDAPQLLINSVSLQNTIAAFDSVLPYLPRDCVICDVASIKTGLEAYYEKSGFRFASVHPMFGPTFVDMASVDALREENAVIIKGSDPATAALFRAFFMHLGVHIFDYTFDEHDRMMGYSLTTPFVASLVFAACMESTAVPGATFARHKKIAKGLLSEDDQLLAEILLNPYSIPQLEKITSRLEFLKHVIRGKDKEEMIKFFGNLRKNLG